MTNLSIYPFVAGAALACVPLILTARETSPHPHHPMIAAVAGAKGDIKLSWRTYDYNPVEVKKAGANYIFNRGFSFKTDVALECGKVKIPAGNYALGFQHDGKGEKWSVVLFNPEITRLNRQKASVRRSGGDTTAIDDQLTALAKTGVKNLTLPTETFQDKPTEHMNIYSINYGYKTVKFGSLEPISGVNAEYRMSFGDVHIKFAFTEILPTKKSGK